MLVSCFCALLFVPQSDTAAQAKPALVLEVLDAELKRTLEHLRQQESEQKETDPVYFLSYAVTDRMFLSATASLGALLDRTESHHRLLDVDVRVGSSKLDNTHEIRGDRGFDGGGGASNLPVEDDFDAIQAGVWSATDEAVKSARERFIKVKTNKAVKVEEEDLSPDFSTEQPSQHIEDPPPFAFDLDGWMAR